MDPDEHATEAARTASDVEPFEDPSELRDRDGVAFSRETRHHEEEAARDDAAADRVAVGAVRDDGALLTLVERDLGVVLLPSEPVAPDADWLATGREAVAAYTGIEVRIDAVEALREVEHVVDGADEPPVTTHRVVLRATPVGGEFDDCKRDAEAGSDGWVAEWNEGAVAGADPPDEDVRADVELFR